MVEPTPATEAQRLLQQSLANLNFCSGWAVIAQLDEPPPHDLVKQVQYTYTYYGTLSQIDLRATIQDRHSLRQRELPLPSEVKTAIATERARVFAYEVRIGTAKAYAEQHRATPAQVDAFVDSAFQKLASDSDFGRADAVLEEYHASHC